MYGWFQASSLSESHFEDFGTSFLLILASKKKKKILPAGTANRNDSEPVAWRGGLPLLYNCTRGSWKVLGAVFLKVVSSALALSFAIRGSRISCYVVGSLSIFPDQKMPDALISLHSTGGWYTERQAKSNDASPDNCHSILKRLGFLCQKYSRTMMVHRKSLVTDLLTFCPGHKHDDILDGCQVCARICRISNHGCWELQSSHHRLSRVHVHPHTELSVFKDPKFAPSLRCILYAQRYSTYLSIPCHCI